LWGAGSLRESNCCAEARCLDDSAQNWNVDWEPEVVAIFRYGFEDNHRGARGVALSFWLVYLYRRAATVELFWTISLPIVFKIQMDI
jgi:hypothetical protein